jgi:hypothetical protein
MPDQHRDDLAVEYRYRFVKSEGVVFIGIAQKKREHSKGARKT